MFGHVLIGLVLVTGATGATVPTAECTVIAAQVGACGGYVNHGDQVDLSGAIYTSAPPTASDSYIPVPLPPPPPAPPEPCELLNRCDYYEVVTIPEVTIEDLVSFRPAAPTVGGEPAGFGVVGLPTNLVAEASEQVIPGTLLGWDVRVRFTPSWFVFDHGDGSSARRATGGATWARLGQAQLTPTATSHVYAARGTYTVSVSTQYSAAVDFGTGWRPVTGFVTAPGGSYGVEVVEARTALVDLTCDENPGGPGC